MPWERVPRAVAASLLAVLPGCGAPERAPLRFNPASITSPGVTCPFGLHADPERGCTGSDEGAAPLRVVEELRMSASFVPESVFYALDGRLLYGWRAADPPAAPRERTPIFDASVPAGDHEIQVLYTFRGHGEGVFRYLDDYHFQVRSTHAIHVARGQEAALTVTAGERGGVTTPLAERPFISWSDGAL